MARRLLSIWFPRLASETSLRKRPLALTHRSGNADHLDYLNMAASARDLTRSMALADARAICPDLATRPADLAREATALAALRRWAGRYAPMVATDGIDGLMADISGVPHLFGGESGLRDVLQARLERAGLHAASAIAGPHGAAHALAPEQIGGGPAIRHKDASAPYSTAEPIPHRAGSKRPITLFPPEPVTAACGTPPTSFRWRRMRFTTLRDYWRIETQEGPRLWLFQTPQAQGWANPVAQSWSTPAGAQNWYVQEEFT